jgi:hypothetical protein
MTFLTLIAIRLTLGSGKCEDACKVFDTTACHTCCGKQPSVRYWWDCDGATPSACCEVTDAKWSDGGCYDTDGEWNNGKPCNLVPAMCTNCDDDTAYTAQARADMCAVDDDVGAPQTLLIWKRCAKTLAHDFMGMFSEAMGQYCTMPTHEDIVDFETYVGLLGASTDRLEAVFTGQTDGISTCWKNVGWMSSTLIASDRLISSFKPSETCDCTPVRTSPTCAASVLEWGSDPTTLTEQVMARPDHSARAAMWAFARIGDPAMNADADPTASATNNPYAAFMETGGGQCYDDGGSKECFETAMVKFKAATNAKYNNIATTQFWQLQEIQYLRREVQKLAVANRPNIQDCEFPPCTNVACKAANTPPPPPPPAAAPAPIGTNASTGTNTLMWVGIFVAAIVLAITAIMLLRRRSKPKPEGINYGRF